VDKKLIYLYSTTIFLGAFLLFQIQPLVAKHLIPHFGGAPAVWTTCMLLFQTLLVGGYAYAHLLTLLKRKGQVYLHLFLLAASLFFLPLSHLDDTPAVISNSPTAQVLYLLVTSIAMPYLFLSASAPLIQYWFICDNRGRSPWKFYALSNAGSLAGLLTYPFLVEPWFDIDRQGVLWGWGYGLFVGLYAFCAVLPILVRRFDLDAGMGSEEETGAVVPERVWRDRPGDVALWFGCSACGSATLLAITNQISQQVAAVPFIWVATLSIYIGTYIVCFAGKRWNSHGMNAIYLVIAALLIPLVLTVGNAWHLPEQTSIFLIALAACCMICHGQIASLQPKPSALTYYYLTIANGGAAGAVLISLLAPIVFTSYVELPILVVCVVAIFLLAIYRTRRSCLVPQWLVWLGGTILVMQIFFAGLYIKTINTGVVTSSRNFYGTLKILMKEDSLGHRLDLNHGITIHGSQYQEQNLRGYATTYYGPYTAAGLALRLHPRRLESNVNQRTLRVGLVGLGVGTLASYGEPGDTFRFYEIDPDIIRLAEERFTFLKDSRARIEIVEGDGRVSLEKEAQNGNQGRFDLLIIDAFNNDAIPVHLATREAVGIYLRNLQPDGILLFHISNRLLDLMPVLHAHAKAYGLSILSIHTPGEPDMGRLDTNWAILSHNQAFLNNEQVKTRASSFSPVLINWTDRFASIWKVMN
jgi:hypothetical protein